LPLTLLLEVNAATGFCDAMPLASEGKSKIEDHAQSICAVLVAQACNIGLKAVVQPGNPALNLGRLAWVQQNYVRSDTILNANAKLVEEHSKLPIVQRWGGGEVASADGLRFVVPVRSIHTGSNSKYFNSQRGITYYTLTSDQFTMLHSIVVPGTLRDSLYILATLLGQRTSLEPKEIMSDTAGYSDVVFGLFHLLGYQFSPRIKDVGGSRYWRIDRTANYGKLNDVSRHRINTALIAQHWDDILRVVGSLKLNSVNATEVMRVLAKEGSLSGLGRAIAEIGRVAKTMYLLEYISNEAYRRRIHTQLNRGESRGRLARVVYHGNRGEMREKYRTGMEDQLGALGLVVNAIALWNSRYMQAALEMVEAIGDKVIEEDVGRLSPLKFAHINMLGRYHFELDQSVLGGDLRPLRDPNTTGVLDSIWEE
jgi:TnpA family transposase